MIPVAIIGAAGRMGGALVRCARRFDDLKIVAAIDGEGCPDIGKDAGVVAGIGEIGVPITDDLTTMTKADVAIDFTFHAAVPGHVELAAEHGRAMVIGTTGLDEEETARVNRAADRIPIVWAPNMSPGVNLLYALVRKAAAVLGAEYRAEVDETHHVHKKDAPSGTALHFAENVARGQKRDFKSVVVFDAEGTGAEHPANKIVVRSHREGEVVGDHTVSFENEYEKIEFTHHAWSRDTFAVGALRAARWIVDRRPRVYDIEEVLELGRGEDRDEKGCDGNRSEPGF